jgi:hypothetical protein
MVESKTPAGAIRNLVNSYPVSFLFVVMSAMCFVLFKDYILFHKVYLFRDIGCDSINIYLPQFNCLADYYKNEGVPGWSFSQGMGQNLFPLWLGDFFSDFMMLFDKKHIPYALAYIEIVKIMLSGFIFFKFLRELRLSAFVCILFALFYAFSGFMLVGGTWVIYSLEALYIAVVMYGFERWLNHGKYFWFCIGIMLLTFLQPFLLFPYTWFLLSYFVARYTDVHGKWNKNLLIFLLKSAGLVILGVMLSGYQLLPDILQMLESPRVGADAGMFDKLRAEPVFGLPDHNLVFATVFRCFGADTVGPGTNFQGWWNYLESPVFYCGVLCLVAFPQFFISLGRKQKWIYLIITVLFFLPVIFPYFRYALWAFTGNYFRSFSLMIVIWLIVFSARGLQHILDNRKVNLLLLALPVIAFIYLLYSPPKEAHVEAIDLLFRTVSVVLLVTYSALLFFLSKKNHYSLKLLLFIICLGELALFSYSPVNNRGTLLAQELEEKSGYNDYSMDAVEFIKKNDKGFYRINKDDYSGGTMWGTVNDAKAQGYYGTQSYHSFNQKNYIRFLTSIGVVSANDEFSSRWARGLTGRNNLFRLMTGKYLLIKHPETDVSGFDSIATFENVKVYRAHVSAPLGITYDTVISEDAFEKLPLHQKDIVLARACVIGESDADVFSKLKKLNSADTAVTSVEGFGEYISNRKKDSLSISYFSENKIKGKVNSHETGILFFSIPFDEGWKSTVDGTPAKVMRVNVGFTGLLLDKGEHEIELSFTPRLKREGSILSWLGILVLCLMMFRDRYRKKAI